MASASACSQLAALGDSISHLGVATQPPLAKAGSGSSSGDDSSGTPGTPTRPLGPVSIEDQLDALLTRQPSLLGFGGSADDSATRSALGPAAALGSAAGPPPAGTSSSGPLYLPASPLGDQAKIDRAISSVVSSSLAKLDKPSKLSAVIHGIGHLPNFAIASMGASSSANPRIQLPVPMHLEHPPGRASPSSSSSRSKSLSKRKSSYSMSLAPPAKRHQPLPP
ncbi:uncharacterized protein AMSG_06004 [Thecamonas trahens ATCC 50062]|uniref:Uncharacterized protein n=1 Tax=Thecamonas trahens ATCC 50062 TaxID=461836 RepID=A0A0L0DBL6_THETB|nr:hypothetical protein AMSG_06004 [Thecamonas trahens ATCC 50062]KNC49734.1 hypothetical protein AMSG_06004 [Thecamonas trahens ATCC 50062]|eukprot:XP_013757521.1 hypothetical protein AMSG_06004 [Thecamonas trahens ATCC 50062]